VADAIPILLRLTTGRKRFVPHTFSLGVWVHPIGWLSVLWCLFTSTVLLFPQVNFSTFFFIIEIRPFVLFRAQQQDPVTPSSLNYSPVVVGGILILITLYWLLSARHSFAGPRRHACAGCSRGA
jgi:hypothetical protein